MPISLTAACSGLTQKHIARAALVVVAGRVPPLAAPTVRGGQLGRRRHGREP